MHRQLATDDGLFTAVGNQAVQQRSEAITGNSKRSSSPIVAARVNQYFSRVPVDTSAPEGIQPKLIVNMPGDFCEQEADRVAEQVMRMPEQLQRAYVCAGECSTCQTEQLRNAHERMQTRRIGARPRTDPNITDCLGRAALPRSAA
jgi:hypothetical protein